MKLDYIVLPSQDGRTLKSLMRETLRLSSTQVRRLKAADSLYVNDAPVYTNHVLQSGDRIHLHLEESAPEYPAEPGELDILYEDELLLAVNKPQGVIVHPTHSRYTGTLANRVWAYLQAQGCDGCHAVNRLDRDTGGIVLFAKNAWACSLMADAVAEKRYLSIVCGRPEPESGSICLPIRQEENGMRRFCAPDGSPSRTDYRVLAFDDSLSLLELQLFTGRTHQIRVHCAAMGWPVLGDRLYGSDASLALSSSIGQTSHALWCVHMKFIHPLTGKTIHLQIPTPKKILSFFEFQY